VAKAYHHGDLYEQLLNAGEQALAEMHVEKVSLREIARRAGVSHAAPKHHFPTLGHLFGEIAARGYERFVTAIGNAAEAATPQTANERLVAMGRAYLAFAEQNPGVYLLIFGQRQEMVMTPNLTASAYVAWMMLVDGAAAFTGPQRAEVAALHTWSFVHGLAMLKLTGRVPPGVLKSNLEERQIRMAIESLRIE